MGLTGVSPNEMQKFAPQDRNKIDLAKKIELKCPSIENAVNLVRSYHDLVTFCQKLGVIG